MLLIKEWVRKGATDWLLRKGHDEAAKCMKNEMFEGYDIKKGCSGAVL